MALRLTNILKERTVDDRVAERIEDYQHRYTGAAERKANYRDFENTYYDLVTDLFEYGWGQSFHFAPRAPNESFAASIARHEHYIAHRLRLAPGMTVVDLGCGVGGPLIEIARFSGARITGINNNALQLHRAAKRSKEAGLSHLADWIQCDFMQVDSPANSFDAAYSIEASCCAPDKTGIYREVFRLLKPGGCFAAYEYCLTDRFDPNDLVHRLLKAEIELTGSLPDIAWPHQVRRSTPGSRFRTDGSPRSGRRRSTRLPVVPASPRLRYFVHQPPKLDRRAPTDPRIALAARTARSGPARDDSGFEPPESCRHRHGGSRASRHFHPDVFFPCS